MKESRRDRYAPAGAADPTFGDFNRRPPPAVVQRLGLGDAVTSHAFDRLAQLTVRLLSADSAMVMLTLGDRNVILGSEGVAPEVLDRGEVERDCALCRPALFHVGPLSVPDTAQDARFADPGAGIGDARAYLGIALVVNGVDPVGVICATARETREWTEADHSALLAIAGIVETEIQLRLEIDRRERDKATLREQANLLNLAHDAIIVRSLDDNIIFWNQGARDVFGWDADEVRGKRSHALLRTEFPARLSEIRAELMETGQWEGDVICYTRADEPRVMGTRWALHHDTDGEVVAVLEISRDITMRRAMEEALRRANARLEDEVEQRTAELRQSEQRFRALIEQSTEIITILSDEGRILYASPSIERVMGWKPEERVGQLSMDGMHPDDVPGIMDALADVLSAPMAQVTVEYRYQHANGAWRVLLSTALNLRHEPAVRGIVVNTRDITELRHNEEQLQQAQKLEAIGRLAGGIAHDFNNVLSIITSIAQLLLLDLPENSPLRAEVEEIDHAATRGANLTRQLLAFSRRQALQPKELNLNEVIEGVDMLVRRSLGAEVEVIGDFTPRLDPIKADPAQVEQIMLNLAVNASDAMPNGGRLTIATSNLTIFERIASLDGTPVNPGRYVRLTVEDTGTGISPEVLPHVLEPFFTTKGAGKGTGLGLSTVYGIVKQSGGYIVITSEIGMGTTFDLYFPVVEEEPDADDTTQERKTAAPNGLAILLEPDADLRRTAESALLMEGFEVATVRDLVEAWQVLHANGSAVGMLVLDSTAVRKAKTSDLDQIRNVGPRPDILLTVSESEALLPVRVGLNAAGAPLAKPFSGQALAQRIHEIRGKESGSPAPPPVIQQRSSTGKILVVDDEDGVRRAIKAYLDRFGHQIEGVPTVEAAIDRLATGPWDLVITDLQLGDGSGLELLARIRSKHPTTSSILISGKAEPEDAAAAIEHGVDRFLIKPLNFGELSVAVEKTLAERRARIRSTQAGRQLEDALRERQRESRIWVLRSAHALVAAVEAKDAYTAGHAGRVTAYATRIAEETGDIDIDAFQLAGDLHDVGKIGVPDAVLNKAGGLTDDEFDFIRQHPVDGERILQPLIDDPMVLNVVRWHHERWDGRGYPDGIRGEDIPLPARILSLADTLDAMTSSRAYRSALSFDVTLAEISRCAGSQFDPAVVDVANKILPDLRKLYNSFNLGSLSVTN